MDKFNERKKLFKTRSGILTVEERRVLNAKNKRNQRGEKRQNDLLKLRGIDEEKQAPTMQSKLEEWKKQKQIAQKKKAVPFVVYSKVKYDDKHLYQPPSCSTNLPQRKTFKAPMGVNAMQLENGPKQEFKVLRSGVKYVNNNSKQNTKEIAKAVSNFKIGFPKSNVPESAVSALRSNKIQENPNIPEISSSKGQLHEEIEKSDVQAAHVSQSTTASANGSAESGVPEILLHLQPHDDQMGDQPFDTTISIPSAMISVSDMSERNDFDTVVLSEQKWEHSSPIAPTTEGLDTFINNPSEGVPELVSDSNKNGDYFRSLLDKEVKGLEELCKTWSTILTKELPEWVVEDINSAIGLAKLLMAQKLSQFRGLIEKFENTTKDEKLQFLATDLEGFWDMVYKQVEDLHKKFNRLSVLKENAWNEPIVMAKRKGIKQTKQTKVQPKGRSDMRAFIAAARNKLKDDENVPSPRKSVAPMSPAVMRVSHIAKVSVPASPQTPKTDRKRSPLKPINIVNKPETELKSPAMHATPVTSTEGATQPTKSVSRPRSMKRLIATPAQGLRRSTRLSKLEITPLNCV